MAFVYQIRRDTAANWTAANPTLLQGEWALETDTDKTKLGDGVTAWSSLPYLLDGLATTASVSSAVSTAVSALVDGSPSALDTLNELSAALGDDANFAATVTSSLALKAPLASPTFTGTPAAPTAEVGTNTTQVATTEFVKTAVDTAVGTGTITSTNIADDTIVNGDISASAAIAYSKLALAGSIVDADIASGAAIAQSKISGLTTSLDAKPDLFIASTAPGTLSNGDFWLDTSAAI